MMVQNCRAGIWSESSRKASTRVWPSPKTLLTLSNRIIGAWGARLVGGGEQQPVVEIMPPARGDAIDLPTRPPALHLFGALDKPGAFEPVQRPIELPVVQAPEVAVEGLELDLELIPVSSFGPRRDQPQERILNHVRRQSTPQAVARIRKELTRAA